MVRINSVHSTSNLQHLESLYVSDFPPSQDPFKIIKLIVREDYAQCVSATATASATSTTSTTTATKTTMLTTTTTTTTKASTGTTTTASTATNSGNPFSGYQLYANPYYSAEVFTSAIPSLTSSLAAKASSVAKVPSFVWL